MKKGTIVFDFDGVIHSYISGWQGCDITCDPPVKGIKESIDAIREEGYEVVIVSTRCATDKGFDAIESYLEEYDITVDKICSTKPPALVYIDDRAITFTGDASNLLEKIKNFEPWTLNSTLVKEFVTSEEEFEDYSFGNTVALSDEFKESLYKFVSVLDEDELARFLVDLYTKDYNSNLSIEERIKSLTYSGDEKVDDAITRRIKRKYGSL